MTHLWVAVLPRVAQDRRSLAWAGFPRSSHPAFHHGFSLVPQAPRTTPRPGVDTLQTRQLYAKHAPNATQVKIARKTLTSKIFSDFLGLLPRFILRLLKLTEGFLGKAELHL